MTANHTPTSNAHRLPHNRSVSVGADPFYTDTHPSTASPRSTSSLAYNKTWEYNNEPTEKLSENIKAAWRRDRHRKHTPVAALRQGFESSHNVTSPSVQPKAARLGLSTIQTISVSPIQETPPSPYHEAPPKDQTIYEYAVTALLNKADHTDRDVDTATNGYDLLLSDLNSYTEHVVQPLPPIPDDQISYVGSDVPDKDKDEEVPEDGIPAHLKKHDAFKTKMRLIQLRTLLMRCQVLQSTMNNVERKPWTQSVHNQPYTHYSKMRKIAYRARELAERLESRELQARCEYWTGRGHGGTQDFEAAAEHFALAMKLDVENDTFPSGRPKLRGLRPNEKEDVRFLFSYALQREKEWRKRTADVREAARIQAEQSNLPYDICLDWNNVSKPAWRPERDDVLRDDKLPDSVSEAEAARLKFSNESFESRQLQLEALHNAELTRRQLSGAEKSYIKHGRKRNTQRQDSAQRTELQRTPEPAATGRGSDMQSPASYPSLHTSLSSQDRRKKPRNLEDELGSWDEEWNSRTPSSSGTFRASTPESQLQQRRNVNLGSIYTGDQHRRVSLGEAIHGEDPDAQP